MLNPDDEGSLAEINDRALLGYTIQWPGIKNALLLLSVPCIWRRQAKGVQVGRY